jgi:hypothetical protein
MRAGVPITGVANRLRHAIKSDQAHAVFAVGRLPGGK